jgi:hypothetical protein
MQIGLKQFNEYENSYISEKKILIITKLFRSFIIIIIFLYSALPMKLLHQ